MEIELKPLEEQVVVITGASSGIGLATARLAAQRGAKVVLAARSRRDLKRAVRQIRQKGGEATWVAADVGRIDQVERIADEALRRYGAIDTWVNNAGVSIYGRLSEVSFEDARRLFDTNYWGLVHGSLVAASLLREKGGAIINVGSVVSDAPIPLQAHYAASKHAVKGFTDSLRLELGEEGAPISVTLVKPASIDTPFTRHARNYMDVEPTLPPPIYAARVVARAILHCATHPRRSVTVGGGGRAMSAISRTVPGLGDRYLETLVGQQRSEEPRKRGRRDSLHRPQRETREEEGDYQGHVAGTSLYTHSVLHPVQTAMAVGLLGAGIVMALRGKRAAEE